MPPRCHLRLALLTAACLAQAGCSIISPVPIWELVKGTTAAASVVMKSSQGKASDTVYHDHAPFKELCIEFNPLAEVADVIPALQLELRNHRIESRVYEPLQQVAACRVWLRYTASIDWGIPTLSGNYRPYVSMAALKLQDANGVVLSTSHYVLDEGFSSSKWSSTRDKLAPTVTALITGIENIGFYKCLDTTPPPTEGKTDEPSPCTR